MKIANEATFRQFDKMKEDIFNKKHDQFQANKQIKNPISSKIRILYPLALMAGGLWLVYSNMTRIRDLLLKKQIITNQELLALDTVKTSLKCRWKQFLENPKQKMGHKLSNDLYITKLESDYLYLTQKRAEKNLEVEVKTKLSWWTLNFGNQETVHYLNQYGDLMKRERQSKIMFGNSFRIWKNSEQKILKREKIFKIYEKEKDNIGNQCERINWINKILLKQQEYQQIFSECKSKSKVVAQKISIFIEKRLSEEKKNKIQHLENP